MPSGPPGSGETTFTARFMAEGSRNGETCTYTTMHETRDELLELSGDDLERLRLPDLLLRDD